VHRPSSQHVTELLARAGEGDATAAEAVFPLIYEQLHGLAEQQMRRERPGHTLQPTALVHEVYMRLLGERDASWSSRSHFFAAAATAMRRILVNHAVARKTAKRGGDRQRVLLDDVAEAFEDRSIDLLALDDALTRLGELSPEQARIVELRFFAGLTVQRTADVLDRSERSVQYDWSMARAWLRGELVGENGL